MFGNSAMSLFGMSHARGPKRYVAGDYSGVAPLGLTSSFASSHNASTTSCEGTTSGGSATHPSSFSSDPHTTGGSDNPSATTATKQRRASPIPTTTANNNNSSGLHHNGGSASNAGPPVISVPPTAPAVPTSHSMSRQVSTTLLPEGDEAMPSRQHSHVEDEARGKAQTAKAPNASSGTSATTTTMTESSKGRLAAMTSVVPTIQTNSGNTTNKNRASAAVSSSSSSLGAPLRGTSLNERAALSRVTTATTATTNRTAGERGEWSMARSAPSALTVPRSGEIGAGGFLNSPTASSSGQSAQSPQVTPLLRPVAGNTIATGAAPPLLSVAAVEGNEAAAGMHAAGYYERDGNAGSTNKGGGGGKGNYGGDNEGQSPVFRASRRSPMAGGSTPSPIRTSGVGVVVGERDASTGATQQQQQPTLPHPSVVLVSNQRRLSTTPLPPPFPPFSSPPAGAAASSVSAKRSASATAGGNESVTQDSGGKPMKPTDRGSRLPPHPPSMSRSHSTIVMDADGEPMNGVEDALIGSHNSSDDAQPLLRTRAATAMVVSSHEFFSSSGSGRTSPVRSRDTPQAQTAVPAAAVVPPPRSRSATHEVTRKGSSNYTNGGSSGGVTRSATTFPISGTGALSSSSSPLVSTVPSAAAVNAASNPSATPAAAAPTAVVGGGLPRPPAAAARATPNAAPPSALPSNRASPAPRVVTGSRSTTTTTSRGDNHPNSNNHTNERNATGAANAGNAHRSAQDRARGSATAPSSRATSSTRRTERGPGVLSSTQQQAATGAAGASSSSSSPLASYSYRPARTSHLSSSASGESVWQQGIRGLTGFLQNIFAPYSSASTMGSSAGAGSSSAWTVAPGGSDSYGRTYFGERGTSYMHMMVPPTPPATPTQDVTSGKATGVPLELQPHVLRRVRFNAAQYDAESEDTVSTTTAETTPSSMIASPVTPFDAHSVRAGLDSPYSPQGRPTTRQLTEQDGLRPAAVFVSPRANGEGRRSSAVVTMRDGEADHSAGGNESGGEARNVPTVSTHRTNRRTQPARWVSNQNKGLNEKLLAHMAEVKEEWLKNVEVSPEVDFPAVTRCCSVCLRHFKDAENVAATPCGHCFHFECIVRWLTQHGTCPYCRGLVLGELPNEKQRDAAEAGQH